MKVLDFTFPTPAENLACDEALLDWRDDEGGDDILRFWTPRDYFVVVGYANKVSLEANGAACAAAGVPILRRCSGGGTVLQGPGCLNYSLIVNITANDPLHSISSANRFIMERNREAIEAEIGKLDPNAAITARGHTDLAIGNRHSAIGNLLKFSGNAQRRKRRFLLFHGTFLLTFDLPLIEKFLPMPSQQPDYRERRRHADFLANVPLSSATVKSALRAAWRADESLGSFPQDRVRLLARDKYVRIEWNLKF